MHGYCNCSRCNTEWASRNAYHIEDDYETPYKKGGRGSSRKVCKKNKTAGTHSFTKKIEVYKQIYNYHEKKYVKTLTTGYICVFCTKPQFYYFY